MNKLYFTACKIYFVCCIFLLAAEPFQPENTMAASAIVYDYSKQQVLFKKNSDQCFSPVSLTKMLTALVVLDSIKNNHYQKSTKVKVPPLKNLSNGTTMYLQKGHLVAVDTLLKGLLVVSANDAAQTLGIFDSGNEAAFASKMTTYAKNLGCKNSIFVNASGYPEKGHVSTVDDILLIAKAYIQNPYAVEIAAMKSFRYKGFQSKNSNTLLSKYPNCNGIKTGYALESGRCLAASATFNGKCYIVIVTGLATKNERDSEAKKLLLWAKNRP